MRSSPGEENRLPLKQADCSAAATQECKNEMSSRLRTMNITASSLFPGLDGLGRDRRSRDDVQQSVNDSHYRRHSLC